MKGLNIMFVELEKGGMLGMYSRRSGERLGKILYEKRWKIWIFEPDYQTFFDSKCLQEIINKLEELKKVPSYKISESYTGRKERP